MEEKEESKALRTSNLFTQGTANELRLIETDGTVSGGVGDEPLPPSPESEELAVESVDKPEDFKACRNLHFGASSPIANLRLENFYPDSLIGIIYNTEVGAYFACNMFHERLVAIPMLKFNTIVNTKDLVLIRFVEKTAKTQEELDAEKLEWGVGKKAVNKVLTTGKDLGGKALDTTVKVGTKAGKVVGKVPGVQTAYQKAKDKFTKVEADTPAEEEVVEVQLEPVRILALYSDGKFKVLDNFEPSLTDDNTNLYFEGQTYSLETSEVKETESHVDEVRPNTIQVEATQEGYADTFLDGKACDIYYYENWTLIHKPSQYLDIIQKDHSKRILLADRNGSYLGHYLPRNDDMTLHLKGEDPYRMSRRFNLCFSIVQNLKTGKLRLLRAGVQALVDLEHYADEELGINFDTLESINGVAWLYNYEEGKGHGLNIFTPHPQRIVLEQAEKGTKNYQWTKDAFGNGLFFPRENVLVLDNGAVIFTKPEGKKYLNVRGKKIKLNKLGKPHVFYLGEL